MGDATTIILCGGLINYRDLPINTNESNAMIPVAGKPVIGWILDDLLEKGIHDVVVVLREHDNRFRSFLGRVYGQRLRIQIALAPEQGTIVDSLNAGLDMVQPGSDLVRVILGDTLVRDGFSQDADFVYASRVEDSERWCLAITDEQGFIIEYVDKQALTGSNHLALVGYYHFLHSEYLKTCVDQSLNQEEPALSSVLRRYGARYPLRSVVAQEWHDFGHIDHLADARRRLMQPRFFNSLQINPILNTITKISQDNEKLRSELNWYLSLPKELQVLTPRILSHDYVDSQLRIVQEYYGYPSLAELYVYSDLKVVAWQPILQHVMRVHEEFCRYTSKPDYAAIDAIYLVKTQQRIGELQRGDDFWNNILGRPTLEYNGNQLSNLPLLNDVLVERVNLLRHTASSTIIHGDYCFSNILFDPNHQIIRLIDPRGSFGEPGIYGDPRYDMAKLRHSISGLYDYVMADMFTFEERAGAFFGEIYSDDKCAQVSAIFDRMLVKAKYQIDEIKLIEALLFLSMLPLHKNAPRRQRMLFFVGLSLLNQVLECESSLI